MYLVPCEIGGRLKAIQLVKYTPDQSICDEMIDVVLFFDSAASPSRPFLRGILDAIHFILFFF